MAVVTGPNTRNSVHLKNVS